MSSVQFRSSVMSDSLWPHEPQHGRPPCPSPTPRVHPNPCPSSQWCHPTISSSVIPFPSCPLSFPASGSFQMSQLFASGGQSIGVSASTSVPPMNTQDWSPLAIINSVAMNVGVHVSLSILVFLGYMPSSGIVRSYGISIPSFLRNLHSVLHSDSSTSGAGKIGQLHVKEWN